LARIAHLQGSSGSLSDPYFLTAATVDDDADLDSLFGEAGLDWFWFSSTDRVNDWVSGEDKTQV
jgi:hypothetical protein